MEEKTKELVGREYQIELFELAVEKNIILYLPTGSGKTFIAVMLMKHFCHVDEEKIVKPIHEGGKRLFFIVNTVALVEQQALHIQTQLNRSVGRYSGDMGVDLWEAETWIKEINEKQILVMTCQIFLDLITKNRMSLRNVNLLIFDECHRGVSNHPMRQVMQQFHAVPPSHQPRVLGLTATLLNGNIKPDKVKDTIRELEITFIAQIQTSLNEDMVKLYSTNAQESVVEFRPNDTSGFCYAICQKKMDNLKLILDRVQIDEKVEPPPNIRPVNSRQIEWKKNKINKRLKNLADDVIIHLADLGVYGGSLAILAHLVQLQQMSPNAQIESARVMYHSVMTEFILLRYYLENELENSSSSPLDALRRFSSHKTTRLLDILKRVKSSDSVIVFVQRRFCAKILYYLVSKAAEIDPQLSHVKCNFIVGYNVGDPFKDTRENYMQRKQNEKVMRMFNQGVLNVLFASNVVEEGVDISKCNYVVMFDPLLDFRAYVQSKGRARDKESHYIIMVAEPESQKFLERYRTFQAVERELKTILYKGKSRERTTPTSEEVDAALFANIPGLEPYRPYGPDGPAVTALSAIPLLNRYFGSLKADKFTKINYFWFVKNENDNRFRCFLQLPAESKYSSQIQGTVQQNIENAKHSVALEACKILHESGELDNEFLLPVGLKDIMDKTDFTPNFDNNETFKEVVGDKTVEVGSKRNKRPFEKKWADWLCKCRPEPGQTVYMHVLHLRPVYTPPDTNRLRMVHSALSLPNSFGLISLKLLPKLAPFPLYLSTGELEASIHSVQKMVFSEEEIDRVLDFHSTIFSSVLGLVKSYMVRDSTNTLNAYLIAPVVIGDNSVVVDWDVVESIATPFPTTDEPPSLEQRAKLKVTDESHLQKMVTPWYSKPGSKKADTKTVHFVTKVCHDMSEETEFLPEVYRTFKHYYEVKYNLVSVLSGQPLLEVKTFSSRLNCTKPRALTKELRKKAKPEKVSDVMLLPEFCVVYPLPGYYWLKALLLPSVLHRVSQLCMAEEVRRRIAEEASLGIVGDPTTDWIKLKGDIALEKDHVSNDEPPTPALKPLTLMSNKTSTDLVTPDIWSPEEEPIDIERNMNSATIFDVIYYDKFVAKSFLSSLAEGGNSLDKLTGSGKFHSTKMVEPPPLPFARWKSNIGPQQVEVMQALTAASTNDFVNCERLETLGDSFLKFIVSLTLFETQPDLQEGHLTNIKGKIVGNKNLYFCGRKKNLGSILEVQMFSPSEDWIPPGFCVPHRVQGVLRAAKLPNNCLSKVVVSEEERRSGIPSNETNDQFAAILGVVEMQPYSQNCTDINQQVLTDKNISDAVEALLGVYLKSMGVFGALSLMKWFGVMSPELLCHEVLTSRPRTAAKGKGDPNIHLQQPELLEDILNYKFRDRTFMLQALCHPSYTRNNITKCYQRLEFLGDALIDFLITIHIYDKCTTLSPGDLTDLRSALVNNITLACITVRNHFYKYLLHHSAILNDIMMRFVRHQQNRNHTIDNDVLFLVEEAEVNIAEAVDVPKALGVNIAEAVDVPKALGDIFEALVGAIYLDSGKNLDVTWKVVYNLMKDEIENFSKNIPKNHVRMLYESNCAPVFSTYAQDSGVVMVSVQIMLKGEKLIFNGFGDNKIQAKRAAAKHALRKILSCTQ